MRRGLPGVVAVAAAPVALVAPADVTARSVANPVAGETARARLTASR